MEGKIRGKIEKMPERQKTGKDLVEEANDGLKSLEKDIENITEDTLPGRREIWLKEAKDRIELLKGAGEKLIEEAIKEGRKYNIEKEEEKITEADTALLTGREWRQKIIDSMEKAKSPEKEIIAQKWELLKDLEKFFYLLLKAEILTGDTTKIGNRRQYIKQRLVKLEKSLAETEEEKEKVSKKWNEQESKWREEFQKQKEEMKSSEDFKINGF